MRDWDQQIGRPQAPPSERHDFARLAVERAESYGLDSQYSIERFVAWMREAGSDFPKLPELTWLCELLGDDASGLPPNARMEVAWQMRSRPDWSDPWDGDPEPQAEAANG